MNTVLIVDDEKLIRAGIKKNIDWDKLELSLLGEAENGLDAIFMIEQHIPDIILLDICMPMMDGLELAKSVKQRYSHTSIIMITGYDEFAFIKEALKVGVDDYILKPVTKDNLTEAIVKVNKKRKVHTNGGLKQEQLSQILLHDKLKSILKGNVEDLSSEAIPLSWNIDSDIKSVAIISIQEILGECWSKALNKSDLINFSILNITNEILLEQRLGYTFFNDDQEIVIIFSLDDEQQENDDILKQFASDIICAIEGYIEIQVCIGIGQVITDLKDIYQSYQSAKSVLDFIMLDNDKGTLSYQDIMNFGNIEMIYPYDLEKNILKSLVDSVANTNEDFLSFFNYIKTNNAKASDIKSGIFMLISSILKYAGEFDVSLSQIKHDKGNIIEIINNYTSMSDIHNMILDFILNTKALLLKYKSRPKELSDKIKTYIDENYFDEGLNLKTMSNSLFISTSYISSIFKNDIGKSFVDYLTEIRINKAKQLLLSSQDKTYEVGFKVGYKTPQYFSTAFKKDTGLSPSQYRKKNLALSAR
jgi:two-component system, response regulator YesN